MADTTDSSLSRKYLYRVLRNLLVNEMGMNRDMIQKVILDFIRQETTDFLKHHVVESKWFQQMLINMTATILREVATAKMKAEIEKGGTITFTVIGKE